MSVNENVSSSGAFTSLAQEKFIQLTTFRKNGTAMPTPVWFAESQGKLYVVTQENSGKIKRIRNNGRVKIAACNARGEVHGEEIEAQARVLAPNEYAHAEQTLSNKYRLTYKIFFFVQNLRRTKRGYIEIAPIQA